MLIKNWIREWSRQSEFNSFNSWKGLLYSNWYAAIKNKNFLPPVEASLDPIHTCNLVCRHCNAHGYLTDYNSKMNRMPDEHLMSIVRYLGEWGVKAICFGGGGEPTMHSKLSDAVLLTKEIGLASSIATNGTLLNDELINIIVKACRWVGISVDAASSTTYKIGREEDKFDVAIANITKLVKEKSIQKTNCDITFKFLIFSYNQHEIYDACRIAKDLGVTSFHVRPADYCHQGMGEFRNKMSGYDVENIKEQLSKCHELENDEFQIFTIIHKFDETLTPKKDFSQCFAAPLCIQLCADGKIYFCPDQRFIEYYELGSHYPDPKNISKAWGSKKHKQLVYSTGKQACDTRCTMTSYNRQCEELFIKDTDPMCKWFV